MSIKSNSIYDLLKSFNEQGIRYVVLRNVQGEFPKNIDKSKDVDLLIHPDDSKKADIIFLKSGFIKIKHPLEQRKLTQYLYGLKRFKFYTDGFINIDICYSLWCHSINNKELIPIHKDINTNAFSKRVSLQEDNIKWYQLRDEEELTHLLTRIIFDEKEYSKYDEYIYEHFANIDITEFKNNLLLVFYKFSDVIIEFIKERKLSELRQAYFRFKDY